MSAKEATKPPAPEPKGEESSFQYFVARTLALIFICYTSFTIRLHAVEVYGRVIHEFDPWFNFRATDYLVRNGVKAFFNWYDDEVWYPLGRPVGTTIYPGLQFSAAALYHFFNAIGFEMTLNDVCVFIPAIFAISATLFCFGIAYETSGSANAGLAAAFFFAITPAHLMRSVAGGYDNESIAVTAIVGTFYFWVRSLKTPSSWPFGLLSAIFYIYMVIAWGGYIFVLNMVGFHTACLIMLGRYSSNLWKSYCIWYVIGTLGAIQLPVVGYTPLKSLEQLGPMGVFFWLHLMEVIAMWKRKNPNASEKQINDFKFLVFAAAGAVVAVGVMMLAPTGYFGPISARIRGLFVQHTRTGNPLVDSVAEHQATRDEMYYQYFHMACWLTPIGFISLFINPTDAKWFSIIYTVCSVYFSRKMIRLILILGPAASICSGIAYEFILTWAFGEITADDEESEKGATSAAKGTPQKKGKPGKKIKSGIENWSAFKELKQTYDENPSGRKAFAMFMILMVSMNTIYYWGHSHRMAENLSNPSIMVLGRGQDGQPVMIDDFREAYWWLRDNTPEDARVMSWWDYGYQINGIANRTTIADGNTWNHEHIALLGKSFVLPVKKSHRIVRHLADYVLVWSTRYGGMWGDDIAKSPHMARIGGSVYKDINPNEFYQDEKGNPSPMMRKSLIWTLVNYRLNPQIPAFKENTFEEVYTTKNRMVRIYKVLKVSKKSKKYCKQGLGYKAWFEGKPLLQAYPPGLAEILAKKEDFAQLEDFNRKDKKKADKESSEEVEDADDDADESEAEE